MTSRDRRRAVALAVGLAVYLAGARAYGEPPIHVKTPSNLQSEGGANLDLPPGYFLDEPTWEKLDREHRRLQEAEIRLDAENRSLRSSVAAAPGWGTWIVGGVTALAAGMVAGWYAAR